MHTLVQVLSPEERHEVHERSLRLLARVGVRVDSERGRQILQKAGARVDANTRQVKFPRPFIENALQAAPRRFSLGGRRPGWQLEMNNGDCTLLADGEAIAVFDSQNQERREPISEDWLKATRLIDALDEVGVYWQMVQYNQNEANPGDVITYWTNLFRNFSKHVQDCLEDPAQTPWLLEVLQIVFGDREAIRRLHPLSWLLCPFSPLIIEASYTDAYLETLGWDIPVAVMPMPLMGATSPASLVTTLTLANCETLAMLCLIEAAAPGTPFIYAPCPAVIHPRSGRYSGGSVELALLGCATTEMGRYYGLPVEASTGGSDHFVPSIQAGYERGINWTLPVLSMPDLLVGPGLLGGSTVLSLEQLILDVEIFRLCKRLQQGIVNREDQWLDEVIAQVGVGGNFLGHPSTRNALHSGEWYLSHIGFHDTYEAWLSRGRPKLLEELHAQVEQILASHQPLPLDESTTRELAHLESRARQAHSHPS